MLRAVATGEIPIITGNEEEADYTPVVIRTKEFGAEWMSVEEAVDRMELVGHDFFLFIDCPHRPPERRLPAQGLGLRRHLADGAAAPPEELAS